MAIGGVLLSPATHAGSWLSEYHLIVSGNLHNLPEVEGRAVVNNLLAGNSFNVGVGYSSPAGQINLAIQGAISGGNAVQVNQGSVYYGSGASSQSGNQWQLPATPGGTRTFLLNHSGATVVATPTTFNFDAIFTGIENESGFYATFTGNSSLTLPGVQPGAARFNVGADLGADNVAVFNLTSAEAAQLFSNSNVQQIELNLNGQNPAAILINVEGAGITYNSGNFVGTFTDSTWRARTMWNFLEADTITMSRGFYGTLLAPYATLSNTGGAMEGAVAVKNLNLSVEVHPPLFAGDFPSLEFSSPVPEPSTWAAIVALCCGAGWQCWHRRKRPQ